MCVQTPTPVGTASSTGVLYKHYTGIRTSIRLERLSHSERQRTHYCKNQCASVFVHTAHLRTALQHLYGYIPVLPQKVQTKYSDHVQSLASRYPRPAQETHSYYKGYVHCIPPLTIILFFKESKAGSFWPPACSLFCVVHLPSVRFFRLLIVFIIFDVKVIYL